MFRWTDDMVRFMRDAAGFGSYQTELAGWICGQIPDAQHVCDAGCGLGFLALQLAQRYPRVTAADISEQALDIAHAQAEEKRVSNLEIVQTDLLAYAPDGVLPVRENAGDSADSKALLRGQNRRDQKGVHAPPVFDVSRAAARRGNRPGSRFPA